MQLLVVEGLIALALILIFTVCRKKGLLSLLSLVCTIAILLKFTIPLIIAGFNPAAITFVSGIVIVALIIYLTEGFHYSSHVAVAASILCFGIISFIAFVSIQALGLSGLVSEESSYVLQYGVSSANLPQILMAGIMIGTLGILSETVVTQVAMVKEIALSNQTQSKPVIFKKAYGLGITHVTSTINTLFLIYAGVALPLLIIIIAGQATLANILHSQLLVSDMLATLVSVVGLLISMPLSTYLAVKFFKYEK